MRYKIHFTWGQYGPEDEVIHEGDTVEEIREESELYFTQRGLLINNCNVWSEEVSDELNSI